MTEFTKQVIQTVKKIPRGKVATYLQISELSGRPGAARGVSWILSSSSRKHSLPWHRVVGSRGGISFPQGSSQFTLQREKLLKEGVVVDEFGKLDLKRFRWRQKGSPAKDRRPRPTLLT